MPERIYSLIFESEDVTWQSLLVDLVRGEGMDPWDIDISVLADKYREVVSEMQQFDVRISAKVVLAAAILLRLKSTHLLDSGLLGLDQLIASTEDQLEYGSFYDSIEDEYLSGSIEINHGIPKLRPKTPQLRKRKVSLDDLMAALRKALEVKERRVLREIENPRVKRPKRQKDITDIIKDIYERIVSFVKREGRPLTFDELVPSEKKSDVIATFVPLLHLATAPHGKIDLRQKKPFGTIEILTLKT